MRTTLLLALLLPTLLLAAPKRPNIIVIYTDDQGFGDASCLNPEAKFQTPNLDRLAAEGIAFTNGHSADSVCTPSRYALLTGRYPWRTERKTGVLGAEAPCMIAEDRMTIASLLRDQGYHTAMVGKWHLGMDFPGDKNTERDWSLPVTGMPMDRGFDHFWGIPASLNYGMLAWFDGRHTEVPPTLWTAKKPNKRHPDYRIMPPYEKARSKVDTKIAGPIEVAPDFVDTECLPRFTDEACRWIGTVKESEKPFFLYLPLTSPHYPVCPNKEFWGQGEAGGYGEFMIETDHRVGQVLALLEKAGIDDDTLVLFTSDNGPEKSWPERLEKFGHDSRGGLREGKRSVYEGGHRVPFLVRWPAGIKAPGRTCDALVGQVDILATVAELVGAEVPETAGEDSESFLTVLTDAGAKHVRPPLVNHGTTGNCLAITEGRWKLVMPGASGGGKKRPSAKKTPELYDLESDPAETKNLLKKHPEIAEDLRAKLTAIACKGNDTGWWNSLSWITEEEYEKAAR